MRLHLKATTALADWLRVEQGERYVRDLVENSEELMKVLFAVAAVSPDPVVREAFARFQLVTEHAGFLKNVLKSKGIDEDE